MAKKHDAHHCEACREEIRALDEALSKVEDHLAKMSGGASGLANRMNPFKKPLSRHINEP
ncbi:MAG TPA: hypothetical protein VID26_04310 [Candidatus Limnocylindrales bacterium]|jgi:hypothetical protein